MNNPLTTKQVSKILGVSTSRVRQWILENRLPAQKIGRDLFIKEHDIQLLKRLPVGRPKGEKMKTGEYNTLKIILDTPFGIYKGVGPYPYYGGELQQNGEPASKQFTCLEEWFKTKKDATAYALQEADDFLKFINHQNKLSEIETVRGQCDICGLVGDRLMDTKDHCQHCGKQSRYTIIK